MTDPPYELGFMGKGWDKTGIANCVDVWREILRVLKPGGHLLAFSGTRTYHRMVCAIEDAGFEIRDQIGWLYGSGFPKSLDVSKAIDKRAGAVREVVGKHPNPATPRKGTFNASFGEAFLTLPASPASDLWQGWGTALKPAWEPIVLARKPLIGTVAENVLKHGTGGINVDGCRVAGKPSGLQPYSRKVKQRESQAANYKEVTFRDHSSGRWPANVIHDGSPEVLAEFAKFGERTSGAMKREVAGYNGDSIFLNGRSGPSNQHGDTGTAARFFYCAKASKKDRDEGCDGALPEKKVICTVHGGLGDKKKPNHPRRNHHPTVKPTALMRYLCKLVTPPGGTVLDPFTGSGSTGKAARLEGFSFIGIERDPEYLKISRARIKAAA